MSSGNNNNRRQPVHNPRTSSARVCSRSYSPPAASPQRNVQGETSRARSTEKTTLGSLPPRKRYRTNCGTIPAEGVGRSSLQGGAPKKVEMWALEHQNSDQVLSFMPFCRCDCNQN